MIYFVHQLLFSYIGEAEHVEIHHRRLYGEIDVAHDNI